MYPQSFGSDTNKGTSMGMPHGDAAWEQPPENQGFLRADVMLGSTAIPLIFGPEDKVCSVPVRIMQGLPYKLVLGTLFSLKSNI